MKKQRIILSKTVYMRRLESYLADRHPMLVGVKELIRIRSEKALFTYLRMIDQGMSVAEANKRADAVLYEGLIFSKFDTVRCILATEFPTIPAT